ncbi:hypothetical protein ANN_10479 [Periplaneta americana]|uniref:Uncharacterized protein n=1 Tax=Periplaneta americana TaxID=6978 RepID=A0ABQ8TQ74_PERAM|nr:hypothetical protein ANN_10479 [Periplaneta americana]
MTGQLSTVIKPQVSIILGYAIERELAKSHEGWKSNTVAEGDQDKSWYPHKVCHSCVEELRSWKNVKRKSLPFGIPMIWREPTNNGDNCYFCTVKVAGYTAKNKKDILYPNIPSVIRPIPHGPDIPVPQPLNQIHYYLDPEALKLNLQWIILMNQAILVMINVLIKDDQVAIPKCSTFPSPFYHQKMCVVTLTDEAFGDKNNPTIDNMPGSQLRAETEVTLNKQGEGMDDYDDESHNGDDEHSKGDGDNGSRNTSDSATDIR